MDSKPDPDSLEGFVSCWTKRSDDAKGDDINFVIDRFIYTYIAYNSLYNAASYVHAQKYDELQQYKFGQGNIQHVDHKGLVQPAPRYNDEKFRASNMVVDMCKNKLKFFFDDHRDDIFEICSCFGAGKLVTKWNYKVNGQTISVTDRDESDNELIMKREDIATLLQRIYSVRCNLIHGSKGFRERELQTKLLNSSTAIVRSLIDILLRQVNEELRKPG